MRIWECFWGPHTFLVGGYQDGLHSAYPDLTPGLPNLNRETNPQPLLLLGLDLGSEPQNMKMEMATERSEASAQAGDGMVCQLEALVKDKGIDFSLPWMTRQLFGIFWPSGSRQRPWYPPSQHDDQLTPV